VRPPEPAHRRADSIRLWLETRPGSRAGPRHFSSCRPTPGGQLGRRPRHGPLGRPGIGLPRPRSQARGRGRTRTRRTRRRWFGRLPLPAGTAGETPPGRASRTRPAPAGSRGNRSENRSARPAPAAGASAMAAVLAAGVLRSSPRCRSRLRGSRAGDAALPTPCRVPQQPSARMQIEPAAPTSMQLRVAGTKPAFLHHSFHVPVRPRSLLSSRSHG